MPKTVLPFLFSDAGPTPRATSHAGMSAYLELMCVIDLLSSIRNNIHICSESQGYTDAQIIMALISLNVGGGQCVDDLEMLECDPAFCRVFRMAEQYRLTRQERRAFASRFRKGRQRTMPSPSVVFRFLAGFHDAEQEKMRPGKTAFIPKPNEALRALARVNAEMLAFLQRRRPSTIATLDMDATIVESCKRDALFTYKGERGYQPFNVYWQEQEALLYSEFRDGNVPAGYEQLRVLKEALEHLPPGVETVRLRSDTAGYQHELLKYCAGGENKRFGKIEFAVGSNVGESFRNEVEKLDEKEWKPLCKKVDGVWLPTGREWAAVPLYVPAETAKSNGYPDYHFLATRELLRQAQLPGLQSAQETLDLPGNPVMMGPAGQKLAYKVFGAVTNRDLPGDEVLRWLYQRCGKSEEVHSVQKQDLAGGQFPSGDFGENAAWWWVMILAFNLNVIMKHLVLGDGWTHRRMKALRFNLIDVAGTVVDHARQFVIKLSVPADIFRKLTDMRRAIYALKAPSPA